MGAAKVIWHGKFKVASVNFLQTKFRAGTKRKKKSRRHGLRREREIGRWQRMVLAGAAADAILVLCQTLLCCCCLPARVSDGLWKSPGRVSPDLSRSVALICANPPREIITLPVSIINSAILWAENGDGGAITCRWNIAAVYWGATGRG